MQHHFCPNARRLSCRFKTLESKNPPIGIIEKPDTIKPIGPLSLIESLMFQCYKNSSHLTLQCNEDERIEVVIYEMLSGVKHTSTLNMIAGEIYTIATPWAKVFTQFV